MKKLTIVSPVFNEHILIEKFIDRVLSITQNFSQYQFDLLIVDDGSTDGTSDVLAKSAKKYSNLNYLSFSRNFGKEAALTAGLQHAKGDAVIFMDSDLQHPPEKIPEMISHWEAGSDVVIMRRTGDEDKSFIRSIGSKIFYWMLTLISDTEILAKTTDFRLLDKSVVQAVSTFSERNRMFRALVDWTGFNRTTIDFIAPAREGGRPTYKTMGLVRLAINTFTTHSLFPLKVAGYFGIFLVTICLALLLSMTVDRLFFDYLGFSNLAFVIVANTLLIGFVLVCLGLIALYIGHIHIEVQNRPLYILKKSKTSNSSSKRESAFPTDQPLS